MECKWFITACCQSVSLQVFARKNVSTAANVTRRISAIVPRATMDCAASSVSVPTTKRIDRLANGIHLMCIYVLFFFCSQVRHTVHARWQVRGQQQVPLSGRPGRQPLRDRPPPAVAVQEAVPSRHVRSDRPVPVLRRLVRTTVQPA